VNRRDADPSSCQTDGQEEACLCVHR
jgi:hypothetical protein